MKFGVFIEESVFIPGDDGGRPGHGYGDETRHFQTLREFDTKEQLELFLLKNQKTVKSRVIRFEEVEYEFKLSVVGGANFHD